MTDEAICFEPASHISRRLRNKELSVSELTGLFLKRAETLNPSSRAFIAIARDEALARARVLDAELSSGSRSLMGIPLAIKDLIDVAGMVTSGGSRVLFDNVATENAAVAERMFAAGGINLGKANLHEFAYGATGVNEHFGTPPNAYDQSRLAGGSSSGSAAALAFGMATLALGTDTGGSVRVPAALNGLVGLKPTLGRIPRHGVLPFCWLLDHVGLITRDVTDCADMLRICAGHDRRDPDSAFVDVPPNYLRNDLSLSQLRVGLPSTYFFKNCDPEILGAVERVIDYLKSAGASFRDVTFPDMEHCRTVSLTVQMPEALSFHSRYLAERGDLYGQDFRAGLALGQHLLAEHYVRAKRFLTYYRLETSRLFDEVDLIITPTIPIIAPPIGVSTVTVNGHEEPVGNALTRYTAFFNMTGHPALTLPCGLHSAGLPIGVQIIGRHWDEATVLSLGAKIAGQENFTIPLPPLQSTSYS